MGELPRIWLIGDPVAHSLSPAFQGAGLRAAGLAWTYEARRTAPAELADVVRRVERGELLGANVTVPYKEAIVPHLARLSFTAARTGAVNTLVRTVYGVEGHNTDVAGLRRLLVEQRAGRALEHALLLGAGGTTRSAVVALDQLGCRRITLVNRTAERAQQLVAIMDERVAAELEATTWDEAAARCDGARIDVVINTTSLGVGAAPGSAAWDEASAAWATLPWGAWSGARAVDATYAPWTTPFLSVAAAHGIDGVDGLDMLLYQGLDAFVLWTSREPDEAAMRRALYAAAGRSEPDSAPEPDAEAGEPAEELKA